MEISTYKEAKRVLKIKGSKVAITPMPDTTPIFAEKSDFISTINQRESNGQKGPEDYDGNSVYFYWNEKELILEVSNCI